MGAGLFRVRASGGEIRWAVGDADRGPDQLARASATLDDVLAEGGGLEHLAETTGDPMEDAVPLLAPVESQEVWAAGVTYLRSRDARVEEAVDASPYDLVYTAARPELFFKSLGWRVRGPGEPIAVRRDSSWNTPEPELALILDSSMRVAGYTIGNDVSSRSIEGENPLYLPQAKVYDGSCALGPCIVPATAVGPPFGIEMSIVRDGAVVYEGSTSTAEMKRSFEELATHLGRAMTFPVGAVLLTGTSLVPESPFTLLPGDIVGIAIPGLGELSNPVVEVGEAA